jgi:SAM-dependent methyltransferase
MSETPQESHRARWMAESFGADPERYDRARPRYPDELLARIVASSPGRDVLDVGTGTGIVARQLAAAGCRVLGVDVDARMAAFARGAGVEVEVAPFEEWDPAGRTFDAVVAGQTWHWVDPVAGAAKAAAVLRPGGRFAAFWNAGQPSDELAEAFAAVYRRVVPQVPMLGRVVPASAGYSAFTGTTSDGLRAAGGFGEPEEWSSAWERTYSRDEWLDQVPTSGGHSRFPADRLAALLDGIGAAIDAAGGEFVVHYTTVAVTATTTPRG